MSSSRNRRAREAEEAVWEPAGEITDDDLLKYARKIQIELLKSLGREYDIANLEPLPPPIDQQPINGSVSSAHRPDELNDPIMVSYRHERRIVRALFQMLTTVPIRLTNREVEALTNGRRLLFRVGRLRRIEIQFDPRAV